MTSHIKTLAATGFLLMALSGPALADPSYAVVHDSSGAVVRNTTGNCVRTKWLTDKDACPRGANLTQDERTIYFEFGKSTLTKEAKARLNSLATKIKALGNDVEGGQIVGYADRIGKPVANEKLSKRRAEAVRAYLASRGVKNLSVAATRWLGATEPTTDCPNNLPKKRLIQCLQNDRRVEVELIFDP